MSRKFDTPEVYSGAIISRIKKARQATDPRRQDLTPAVLDFGPVRFVLARHFGFCYGVENAIEIAYRTLDEHAGRPIYFLSEMIHNPRVNGDLQERGVRFIFTPAGEQLIPWGEIQPGDIVVVPAFGTTLEMQERMAERGVDPYTYNTTCPFVEKVWKRSAQLGSSGYTVVVHGKATHEETRATFSHSARGTPTVVVLDLEEAQMLADMIRGHRPTPDFDRHFGHKCSPGFSPERDLARIGVVNQTTMLATETREIAALLRRALADRYGAQAMGERYADTSDTLCYATNENQNATYALIERGADIALVVGGYNSSNTSHIVELLGQRMPTYFVKGAEEILSRETLEHFVLADRSTHRSEGWLPSSRPVDIVLTSGASCPDAIIDEMLYRVTSFFEDIRPLESVLSPWPETPPAESDR